MDILIVGGMFFILKNLFEKKESFSGGNNENSLNNTISNSNVRAAIIPHAGEQYAGDCRKNAFINLDSNAKYIIYIAAIHNSMGLDQNGYLLKRDNGFPNLIDLPDLPNREHSFDWVESELRSNFRQAKIFAFSPLRLNIDHVNKIVNFMKNNDCILLGTTDLVHYGSRFENTELLGYPEKLKKQKYEEEFLNEITKTKLNLVNINSIIKKEDLLCGPYAINLFMNVMKELNYKGKIIDYYDSSSSEEKDLLNKYTIKPENTPEFVSYVSVVYGDNVNRDYLTKFDIMTAIGMVKSRIYQDVYNQNNKYNLEFHKWSVFNRRDHGIFVGTELNGDTNCSYGRFEGGDYSYSSNKILEASDDCKEDASGRWGISYNKDNLEKMKYKIELLDSMNTWKTITGNDILSDFKLDGRHGMRIIFPDGAGATYLPVVAKDMLGKWDIYEYMNSLTKKAYRGSKKINVNTWKNKNVKVEIYKSVSYTWNPIDQNIEIF
jgi:predicted class III extradiol MEMO1 family dioxygenase